MKWEHRASIEWMRERQKYLTVSDIKVLLPVTKTGRARKITDADYIKVMASKMTTVTPDDCMSYGAAARGHLLEPYAVEALNEALRETLCGEQFYWWDDEVIGSQVGGPAFSPDAMDVPMGTEDARYKVTAIAEIKSYSAEKHLVTAYTPKDQIEERWQIATAMAVLPNIDHAYLVLYNPSMKKRKLFVIRFDRSELEDEIDTVDEVCASWDIFRKHGCLSKPTKNGAKWYGIGGSEERIAKEIEARQRLNP